MYSKKVLEHFKNPVGAGVLKDANGIGKVGDPSCGDMLCLYIKVENDVIVDASFQVVGCPAAIASGSMLVKMIKGKKVQDALKITNKDVVEELGGLPPEKVHCSVMAEEALVKAVENFRQNMADIYAGKGYEFSGHIQFCGDKCVCGASGGYDPLKDPNLSEEEKKKIMMAIVTGNAYF